MWFVVALDLFWFLQFLINSSHQIYEVDVTDRELHWTTAFETPCIVFESIFPALLLQVSCSKDEREGFKKKSGVWAQKTSRLWSFNESCYRSWVSAADPSWKVGSVWEPTGGQVPATAYSPHNYPLTCCQKENTLHCPQPSSDISSKRNYTTIH